MESCVRRRSLRKSWLFYGRAGRILAASTGLFDYDTADQSRVEDVRKLISVVKVCQKIGSYRAGLPLSSSEGPWAERLVCAWGVVLGEGPGTDCSASQRNTLEEGRHAL